ncbi:MAG: right-handed parallel beta-helix repeat-containing protein [Candidatus Hermodarchaeota archaeon]
MTPSQKLFFSLVVVSFLLLMNSSGTSLFQLAEGRHVESFPKADSNNNSILKKYALHDPITVNNDTELAAIANSGVGSANDPYIITGRNITSSTTGGIYITGTTKHFRIEKCRLSECGLGIFVENVASGTVTITNNTCINNSFYGIRVRDSDFSNITDNTCNSNEYSGIILRSSSFSLLSNNTCSSNNEIGIHLLDSSSSTVVNSTCSGNEYSGIDLQGSSSSTITDNICNSNGRNGTFLSSSGIILHSSRFSLLSNNTCDSNDEAGIQLISSSSSIVVNNTCNRNGNSGIFLISSDSSTVINNSCNNNTDYGIYAFDHNNVTLINNICSDNDVADIYLYDSGPSLPPTTPTPTLITTPTTNVTPRDPSIADRLFLFLIIIGLLLIVLCIKKD